MRKSPLQQPKQYRMTEARSKRQPEGEKRESERVRNEERECANNSEN